MESTDLHKAGY